MRKLLNEIGKLRHMEDGEERVGQRWVKRRNPSEATKERLKRSRLKLQQKVIEQMRPKA